MGADFVLLALHVKARRTIEAVSVEERHGRHFQFGGSLDERFRQRSTLEKAEGAGGMKLDIRVSHRAPRYTNGR
jgi:hypothetical protein